MESLVVSNIPAGDGNVANLFLQCTKNAPEPFQHFFNEEQYPHLLKVLSIQKWGGREGTFRIVMTFHTIADVFSVHLKGYSFALNRKKPFSAFGPKKRGVLFYVMCAAKNWEACCDVALLLLVMVWGINFYTWRWRNVRYHHRSFVETLSFASKLKKYSLFFP